jgi:hypothetical protein
MKVRNVFPRFPFQKTAPGQERGIASDTAEIQARIIFSFFDEMATEASLKSEDIEFCGGCQQKVFGKMIF